MKYALTKYQLIGSTSIKKRNIVLYIIISFIFLNIAVFTIQKSTNVYYATSLNSKVSFISNKQLVQNFSFVFPWIIIIGLIAIFLSTIGAFTKSNPKMLAELLTSRIFDIEFTLNQNNVEIGLIKLPLGVLEITWNQTSGQFYTWSLLLKITLQDSANKNNFELFNKLLFMEKDETDELTYKKVIFARDWPRQDYLLSYWLQGLNL